MIRKYVVVKGIVQGVGFRPFVYKIATENKLNGWVNNTSEGVYIDVEGDEKNIEIFLDKLENHAPPLSQINEVIIENKVLICYKDFTIKISENNNYSITLISPDVATCDECRDDILDKNNRRYKYPFTNCTNCGPRFSIIKELPYDRPMTTMKEFKMCEKCKEEYENPLDRRFHAQPNACAECGPKVWLTDKNGNEIFIDEPINEAKRLIKEGNIIAIKGLGGFHIVCDGKNEKAIDTLRKRKLRPSKPLALMMKDINIVEKYCNVNQKENEILQGIKKPIVLLDKNNDLLPNNIAPNNKKLGVMLPYTPLHYLLFDKDLECLVMTSANVSGLPIVYKNDEALKDLNNIVDYFLFHNREIHIPVDDSVVKVLLDKEIVIRRSRGYAPVPIKYEKMEEILATGADLKNTFTISKEGYLFTSQYIGDLDNLENYNNYEHNINHFKSIYNIKPKVIAHDMHPNFLSTEYANNKDVTKIKVQHHHAHIASCMVENNIDEKVIGIAFDGTGLGDDNKIWGGEFLICDYLDYKRAAHLNYVKMPGGDYAVKEPYRMALSYLYNLNKENIYIDKLSHLNSKNIKAIITMLKNNINCVETCSVGRFFDAVSALLGFNEKISFEGEAAIYLESIANKDVNKCYKYEIKNNEDKLVINTNEIIKGILNDIENKVDKSIISMKFHNTIISFSIDVCKQLSIKHNIDKVALSGGVFNNEILLKGIYNRLLKDNFKVYIHSSIPCNDGGISLGQIAIANKKLKCRR